MLKLTPFYFPDLFEEGLGKMTAYLAFLSKHPSTFAASQLISLMDDFKDPLGHHFGQQGEIHHLASLSSAYPDRPELEDLFATWCRRHLIRAGILDGIPFLLSNFDRSFEEARWNDWPAAVPAPVKWALRTVAGPWNEKLWRFGSCNLTGERRVLEALK